MTSFFLGFRNIPGIRGYQLLLSKENEDTRKVLYRKTICWCLPCIQRDYAGCKTGASWTCVDLELPQVLVTADIHQVQAVNEQESTELSTELSVLPSDPPSLVQAPQIDESSAPSMWSKESECSINSTVGVFKGDDAGKIGTCKEIVGGKRVKSYTIKWSDLSESVLSRKEFYVKKTVENVE